MTVKDSQIVAIHPSSVLNHKPEVFSIYYNIIVGSISGLRAYKQKLS